MLWAREPLLVQALYGCRKAAHVWHCAQTQSVGNVETHEWSCWEAAQVQQGWCWARASNPCWTQAELVQNDWVSLHHISSTSCGPHVNGFSDVRGIFQPPYLGSWKLNSNVVGRDNRHINSVSDSSIERGRRVGRSGGRHSSARRDLSTARGRLGSTWLLQMEAINLECLWCGLEQCKQEPWIIQHLVRRAGKDPLQFFPSLPLFLSPSFLSPHLP